MKLILAFLLALNPSFVFAQAAPGKIDDSTVHVGASAPTNYVKNPSAIFTDTLGKTTSSATMVRDTDTADKLDGKASWLCDSSSQNGYCEFDTNTIQEGDKTGNCEAKAVFKGDASLYKLQVTDGSSVLTSSAVLSNATDWTEVYVNYPCGSTREVRLTQTESGTGAAVNIGRVYWGRATNLGVANQIGSCQTVTMTSSWVSNTTITAVECRGGDQATYRVKAAVAGGAPTSTSLTFTLPTGRTIDTTKLASTTSAAIRGTGTCSDSGSSSPCFPRYSSTTVVSVGAVNTASTYADGASVTQAVPFTFGDGDEVNVEFTVPIVGWGPQPVVNDNLTPWYIDATMDGGTPGLGLSSVASYTEITNSSLTLKPQSGSAPVGVMCSASNSATSPSTGNTTCSVGDESLGINFSIPKAGSYEVCAQFAHEMVADASEYIVAAFQLIETPTNAQTLTLEGGTRSQSYLQGSATDTGGGWPISSCSIFNWSSNGIKGVRLMYEQLVGGTPDTSNIAMDGSGSVGQRNLRWTVEPVTNASPMPLLVGSVTSNSSGLERSERAYITYSAGVPSVTSQSGSWITSVTDNGTGDATLVIPSGIFSSAPSCNATAQASGATNYIAKITAATTTTAASIYLTDHANTAADVNFYIHCQGPR